MAQSNGGRAARTVILIVVVLALLAAAAEIGARMYAGRTVADEFRSINAEHGVTTDAAPDVSFGSSSLVLGYLAGDIGQVDLGTPSTLQVTDPGAEEGAPGVVGIPPVDIRIRDLDVSDRNDPVAGSATVAVVLSAQLLQASANREILARPADGAIGAMLADAIRVTGLHSDPGRDLMVAEFGGGLVTIDFRPRAQAGDAVVDVLGGSIAGFGVDGFVQRVADQAVRGPIADLGEDMSIDSFEVVDDGLLVHLSGTDVSASDLEKLAQQAQ